MSLDQMFEYKPGQREFFNINCGLIIEVYRNESVVLKLLK